MANKEHLQKLTEDKSGSPTQWNQWKSSRPDGFIVDLSEADLSGAELNGFDLSNANLDKAKLVKTKLANANLHKASLNEAFLIKADLSKANLSGANLSGADLSKADLSEADLSNANLSGAELSKAKLAGANLSGANQSGADLSGADLSKANQSGADLSGADLSGTNQSGANLSGANVSKANLSGANLSKSNLEGVDLTKANSAGADLSGADINNARIRLAPFNFIPKGWYACDGRELVIKDHEQLYLSIGTKYGGDGKTTFKLPDLKAPLEKLTYIIHANSDQQTLIAEIRLVKSNEEVDQSMMKCDGSLHPINNYTALYSLIGTFFGGDGRTTFALPNIDHSKLPEGKGYYIATAGEYPSRY